MYCQRIGWILFALLAGYLLQLIDGANLLINPSGQSQNQPAGRGFGLTCQGEAENPDLFTQMKWRGPKGDLSEGGSGPVEVSSIGSTLILMFKSPATDDSGAYNCTAIYDNIDELSTSVNLVFYQDITWEDCAEQQALVVNTDGKITCKVSANPPATITWSRQGQALEDRYINKGDGIIVHSVTKEDKGTFMVRAMVQQTGRFQNRVIKVEVHDPPDIIELEDRAEAIEGNEITLNCKASGFPLPLYTWFDKDHRDLRYVDGYSVDADTGTLKFINVKREDQGKYTCQARNPAGEAEKSLDFTVIVKPEIKKFDNITSVQGQSAVFECQAYGDPPPEMSIRKDGVERPFSDDDDGINLMRRNEEGTATIKLTIHTVSRSDDGLYYCSAENKGSHVSKVGHLTVEFGPVMSSTPSTVVWTWSGNAANLSCVAESIPNATITWSHLGKEIRENEIYKVVTNAGYSNLQVRPPMAPIRGGDDQIYGNFRCDASNVHGEEYINIELKEARVPSRLLDVLTAKETATTLTFTFRGPQDDGGLPVRAFVVKYREENEPFDEGQLHEWSEGTPYILQNLRPRTTYTFQFAARNEVGIGEWTQDRPIVMPKEAAPESPKFITPGSNISTYPDRYNIRWTVPLDNGKTIEFFELRYFEVDRRDHTKRIGDPISRKITEWANSPMYEMKDLKANSYYKVEVRAHNDIGNSIDATMVFQTAADPSKRSQGHSPVSLPGSDHDGTNDGYHSGSSGSLSSGAIAAIVIALLLLIILLVDATCYLRYKWGFLHFLHHRVCAKPINDKAKEAAAEEGKGGKGDKMEEKSRTEVDNPAFDAKDTKPNDGDADVKNKSPKGSKSSIAKDSLV